MENSEIMTRIIKLESEIMSKVLNDRNFKPHLEDEFKDHRIEIEKLRKKVWDIIHPKSCLPGGDPQRPNQEELEVWKKNNLGG
jgi:hypothetical protein